MQGRMRKTVINNIENMFDLNIDKKKIALMDRFLNIFFDTYAYLTQEDFDKIDEIDCEILNIDNQLYCSITGDSSIENKSGIDLINIIKSETKNPYLQLFFKIGTEIYNGVKNDRISMENVEELLSKRQALISDRNTIINTSKERIMNNNPEQYKVMQELIKQQKLQMRTGKLDIASFLGIE